jgi:hypothetical protein
MARRPPAGTIEPLLTWNWDEQEDGVEPRFGVLMNPYTPATGPIRQLFVRAVQQLHCDRQHRRRGHRLEPGLRTWSRQSHQHALAANPGRSCGRAEGRNNPNWESNTRLDNGSGIYAANRGNNTIVRMHQDGSIVAVRRVALDDVPLDDASLNGIGPR